DFDGNSRHRIRGAVLTDRVCANGKQIKNTICLPLNYPSWERLHYIPLILRQWSWFHKRHQTITLKSLSEGKLSVAVLTNRLDVRKNKLQLASHARLVRDFETRYNPFGVGVDPTC